MKSRVTDVILLTLLLTIEISAQTPPKNRPTAITTSPLCTRSNAVDTLQQQIAASRTFENSIQRIAVLIRSADLLWPYQRDKALATFLEAFELAKQNFKETGDTERHDSKFLRSDVPDQRYKVIAAIAKRAPAEARKLSEQMLSETMREAENGSAGSTENKWKIAEKLLTLAIDLSSTNPSDSSIFARASLQYPATLWLPLYLYQLAKTSRPSADLFFEEALRAYGAAPMSQFLYLSAYPFANTRDAGEMPGWTIYRVPEGFTPSPRLQSLFVRQLLARVQTTLATPIDSSTSERYSDSAQMWMALSRLETQISQSLPDLAPASVEAKDKLFALLSPANQEQITGRVAADNRPQLSFEAQVEAAEKVSDVNRRDNLLTSAVASGSKEASVETVVAAIDKISDSSIRELLLNWFYFFRSQALIGNRNLDEAHRLAAKVTELDQRAYLYARIAEESLKENEDQTQAREMLNEIADAASKAPKTMVTARALLALASLYSRIDANRGIEGLALAVKVINSLEAADFSVQYVPMKIETKTWGTYSGFSTPGFNPENVFKDVAKVDFDGSLIQAATLTDKLLRSLTTMSVIEPCLDVVPGTKQKKRI